MLAQYSQKNLVAVVIAVILLGQSYVLAASDQEKPDIFQDPAASPDASAKSTSVELADKTDGKPAFQPYIGEITGENVYIRSGPGGIYHQMGKFQKNQKVVVRLERRGNHNWAMIEPTSQCFSYIAKKYVKIVDSDSTFQGPQPEKPTTTNTALDKKADPDALSDPVDTSLAQTVPQDSISGKKILIGRVIGKNVRVRAGSIKALPENAQVQILLSNPASVKIIGQRGDFYKIISPPNACFWVSLNYVKRVGPVDPQHLADLRSRTFQDISGDSTPEQTFQVESQRQEYIDLAQMFESLQNSPLKDRHYQPLSDRLEKLITTAKSSSVESAARRLSRNLNKAILAQQTLLASLQQDERLKITLAKIDKKNENLVLQNIIPRQSENDIVVKGRLASSAVFTAELQNRRYRLLDENENTKYYAISIHGGLDLGLWLDKKVLLVGQPQYDAFGKIHLLYVSNIVELPSE